MRATELVAQKEISESRTLAGHVFVWGTEPVSGVTVELCSDDWKTVFKSTKTDEKGHFSLEPLERQDQDREDRAKSGDLLRSFTPHYRSTDELGYV